MQARSQRLESRVQAVQRCVTWSFCLQVWVLDALPGEVRTGGEEAQDHPRSLIAHLRGMQMPLPNRTALQNNLLEAGYSMTIARWASTNLQPLDGDPRSASWYRRMSAVVCLVGLQQVCTAFLSPRYESCECRTLQRFGSHYGRATRHWSCPKCVLAICMLMLWLLAC